MLTPLGTSPETGPWRCARCDADRAADDTFCGRCGSRRPVDTGAATPASRERWQRFPIVRALALNGVIVGAVVLAIALGRGNGGPSTIAFEPATWRCDGSDRAWIATLPASAFDVRLDWMTGGPAGDVRATSTVALVALETSRQPDGRYRVVTTSQDAPECGLEAGPYTMAIRDAASNALLASGSVDLAARP
jgi:hypothetical protein